MWNLKSEILEMCINKVLNYGFYQTVKDKCLKFDIIVILGHKLNTRKSQKFNISKGAWEKF